MKPNFRRNFRAVAVSAASAALLFAGCKKDEKPADAQPVKPAPQAVLPKPVLPPEQRADEECAGPVDLAPPTQVNFAGRTANLTGYKLTFADKDSDGKLVLGVLGPVNEDSGANLLNIKKYNAFFKEQKADAIVVTGDVAETASGITRALTAIAESKLPVFVIAGNRECRADFTNGVLEAQKTAPNVVNMNQVRAVEFPEATLVSLPGYHDPSYLSCATGCQYFKSTVDEVIRVSKEAKSPVVLVAHGPPRGDGSQALDYASSGGNVGDTEITRAITEAKIPFGVFSNIKEAGARAVDSAAGATLVKEGQTSKSLFLNPGPADGMGWEMNDSTKSTGLAAVFAIEGDQANWKLFRAEPLSAAEKSVAKGLDPKTQPVTASPAVP
ncbi:MAG: metallophosphoesterase [Myxococcaceae bacterium]